MEETKYNTVQKIFHMQLFLSPVSLLVVAKKTSTNTAGIWQNPDHTNYYEIFTAKGTCTCVCIHAFYQMQM